jgi:hypothetical protein
LAEDEIHEALGSICLINPSLAISSVQRLISSVDRDRRHRPAVIAIEALHLAEGHDIHLQIALRDLLANCPGNVYGRTGERGAGNIVAYFDRNSYVK